MKRIVLLFALLIALPCYGQQGWLVDNFGNHKPLDLARMNVGIMAGSGTSAAASCSCVTASGNILFHENFRAAFGSNGGWCNAGFNTNLVVEANASFSPNSTAVADPDSGSCEVAYIASTDMSATTKAFSYAGFTEQTGAVYFKVVFRFNGAWAHDSWADVDMASVGANTDSGNNDAILKINDSGDNFIVRACNFGTGCVTAATIANTNTDWHTIVYKYTSDGTTTVKFKFDGGSETEITGADSNQSAAYVTLGWPFSDISDEPKVYFGQVMVCNSSGATDCGY